MPQANRKTGGRSSGEELTTAIIREFNRLPVSQPEPGLFSAGKTPSGH
jgi:hypothetical protein